MSHTCDALIVPRTPGDEIRCFEAELESIIASLEETAQALKAHEFTDEAGLVWNHVKQLRNPATRSGFHRVIRTKRIPARKAVDNLMTNLACTIKD